DAIELRERPQQLRPRDGPLRQRAHRDLAEKGIRHLGAERVALGKVLRGELIELPVLREVEAAAAGVANFENNVSSQFLLNVEIPLRAVRRDVGAVPESDGLSKQSPET